MSRDCVIGLSIQVHTYLCAIIFLSLASQGSEVIVADFFCKVNSSSSDRNSGGAPSLYSAVSA